MARCEHVAGPREPTWTLAWHLRGARMSSGWQVMGPGKKFGAVTDNMLNEHSKT